MTQRKLNWFALVTNLAMILTLVLGKRFFQVGSLWSTKNHTFRSIELVPFDQLKYTDVWFTAIFSYGGNIALFVPFGFILCSMFHVKHRLLATVGVGALLSLALEVTQYIFALGYTDIDDLIMNTVGAFLGGLLAVITKENWQRYIRWICILIPFIFAGVVYFF